MSGCREVKMVASVKNSGMHSSGVHWYMRAIDAGYSCGSHLARTYLHRTWRGGT